MVSNQVGLWYNLQLNEAWTINIKIKISEYTINKLIFSNKYSNYKNISIFFVYVLYNSKITKDII